LSISNRDGNFSIYAERSDTLILTAIGFKDFVVTAYDIFTTQGPLVVVMQPATYAISEVIIHPLGTYDQFKRKFLALKLPPPIDYNALLGFQRPVKPLIPVEYNYKIVRNPLYAIAHPVTYFYKRFNKEEQMKINYYRFFTEEWPIIEAIEKKYNGKKVAELTGLEGEHLVEFMGFCQFERNFLYTTSEYDIGIAILEKLKEFQDLPGKE
jgi:hypothetical protein